MSDLPIGYKENRIATPFQLSNYPQTSADYLRLYREAGLGMERGEQAQPNSVAYQKALASIKTEYTDFDVYLAATDGVVAPEILQTAEDVMARIVELDAVATAQVTGECYEEYLAYVDITPEEIELHYFAGSVNTEWGAYFVRDEHGEFTLDTLG